MASRALQLAVGCTVRVLAYRFDGDEYAWTKQTFRGKYATARIEGEVTDIAG